MRKVNVHPLRELRNSLNLTQKGLAEVTGVAAQTILRAEHGKPINAESRRILCEYFNKSPEELGLVADKGPPKKGERVRREQSSVRLPALTQAIAQGILLAAQELESPHMDKSRRNFLQMLGVTGATLVSPARESPRSPLWDRLSKALAHSSQFDEEALLLLEANARDCWLLLPDVLGTFSRGLLDYVLEQLEIVTALLEGSPVAAVRSRLASVAGELTQIVGELLFDLKVNRQAEQYYSASVEAALVAQNDVLQAVALGRKSFIPIYEHDAGRALPLLQQAHSLTANGAPNITRAWLSAVEAEALANLSNEKECRTALDRSATFLERVQPGESSYARFSYPTLLGYRGVCAVRLKQPLLAQAALNESLATMDPHRVRHRSIVLIDLATTYVQQKEIEGACHYAGQALDIIRQTKSARVFQRALVLRKQLDQWKMTRTVRELDERIADTGTFVARQESL